MPLKKIVFALFILLLLVALASAYLYFGSGTSFNGKKYDLYIRTGSTYPDVMDSLTHNHVVTFPSVFGWLAHRVDYDHQVKAGKYEITSGTSLPEIVRMLHNGRQTPVNLVITKLRTREDLAGLVGRKFECDSISFLRFLENNDSLKRYSLDSNTAMTMVLPNTYTYYWNTTPSRIFKKMELAHETFWTAARKSEAASHGLYPTSAYILASIVEEETNRRDDKGKVASVYLNRLSAGMHLAADPTIKFAMKNFELKRIYTKYLKVVSPYNTYENGGLPPGPICTPSEETIDSVIHAPKTKYLYFVAKPDFSGYSNFAETFSEHIQFARAYQAALDEAAKSRQPAAAAAQ